MKVITVQQKKGFKESVYDVQRLMEHGLGESAVIDMSKPVYFKDLVRVLLGEEEFNKIFQEDLTQQ